MRSKYTKEQLTEAVAASLSVAGVMRHVGLSFTGGSHQHMKCLLRAYGIDTSHFLGRACNRGDLHRPAKKNAAELLCLKSHLSNPTAAHRLRRALLEIGRKERCEVCGLGATWNGRPYQLQIDHRNGKRWDNRPKNLRYICHNCHSQTENYGAKRRSASRARR